MGARGDVTTTVQKTKKPKEAVRGLEVDEDRGVITSYGQRFLFIPVELIHSIEDRLADIVGPVTATSFEYEIGKRGGAHYIQMARKAGFNITDPKEVEKVAYNLGTSSGWGKLDLQDIDFRKSLISIRWVNGVSVRNRKGKTPVCHFGRGVLTGAAEAIFGRTMESIETMCQGKGDKYCQAVIGPPEEVARFAESGPSQSR